MPDTVIGRESTTAASPTRWAAALCWAVIAVDGFDLVVIGAVIPVLSATGDLGFTDASLTVASTLGLLGVGLGAVLTGSTTGRWGRRTTLLGSILLFSVATLVGGLSASVAMFVIMRFTAGLGLGACLPTALSFVAERADAGKNATAVTTSMTGNHVGAVLTALLALILVPTLGWRSMLVVGGLLGFLLLPVLWLKLPRTSRERPSAVTADPKDAIRSWTRLASGARLRKNLSLWIASFMGLLLVFGLNTWLPRIMIQAGYSLQTGVGLLLVLNIGAVIGLLIAGRISDRRGTKATVLIWFGSAAVLLALLSIRLQSQLLVFAAVLITGIFVFSAQALVYAFTTQLHPPELQAGALGLVAGVGRLGAVFGPFILGSLVTLGVAYPWGFYVLAGAAAVAVLSLATVSVRKPM